MAIPLRISGGKLAATEETEFMLGAQLGAMTTSLQANPLSPKVLPVIEPGRNYGSEAPLTTGDLRPLACPEIIVSVHRLLEG